MDIFLLLFLSHLIADFPLQTDFIFKARYKYKYGGVYHILVHTVCNIFFLTPFLTYYQTWIAIAGISLLHYFIDRIKKTNIITFFLDQILHIGILIVVAIGLRGLNPLYILGDVNNLFFNTELILILIGFMFSTFFSTIFIYFIKMTWFKDYNDTPLEGYEKFSGFIDRGVVYLLIVLGLLHGKYYILPLCIIPPALRIVLWRRGKERDNHRNVYLQDIIMGFIITVVISVTIYLLIYYYLVRS